jgi:hypothetical protein
VTKDSIQTDVKYLETFMPHTTICLELFVYAFGPEPMPKIEKIDLMMLGDLIF